MEEFDPIALNQRIEAADELRGLRYEDMNDTQRRAAERALGYFDYFHGYGDAETEEDRQRLFNSAIEEFTEDYELQNLTPMQQFASLIGMFFRAIGLDTTQIEGFGLDSLPEPDWERGEASREGAEVSRPSSNVDGGQLGTTHAIPDGASRTDGRYRVMVVSTDNSSSDQSISGEMVIVDPQGEVVWRTDVHSGANGRGNGSLPGMGEDLGRAITTTYEINYNDIRVNRRDRVGRQGMSYSDGTPGYSFTLENPDNMAEIGGAGRNYFRIHPMGRSVGTLGCIEILDDADAREFLEFMQSLPANERPYGLEVLAANHLQPIRAAERSNGVVTSSRNDGITLAGALASAGVTLDSDLNRGLRDGNVSRNEFQAVVHALRDIASTLTGVDLSNGMDFDGNNVVNARDVRALTTALGA